MKVSRELYGIKTCMDTRAWHNLHRTTTQEEPSRRVPRETGGPGLGPTEGSSTDTTTEIKRFSIFNIYFARSLKGKTLIISK